LTEKLKEDLWQEKNIRYLYSVGYIGKSKSYLRVIIAIFINVS